LRSDFYPEKGKVVDMIKKDSVTEEEGNVEIMEESKDNDHRM
jgi:hypothetical protein